MSDLEQEWSTLVRVEPVIWLPFVNHYFYTILRFSQSHYTLIFFRLMITRHEIEDNMFNDEYLVDE